MSYFKQLHDLPILDLEKELNQMFSKKLLSWGNGNQICVNTLPTHPDDYFIGVGSLWLDWDNKKEIKLSDGSIEYDIPERENPREETDFSILCNVFRDTLFEEIYLSLKSKYTLGRIRLMKMKPKTCLSWHQDVCNRIHFPIKTEPGCLMIIDNEVKHMPKNTWWYTNTFPYHTAINASKLERIHLVCSVES